MQKFYFLGGTSPEGFKSRFIKQIEKDGYYTYILKGGPGTGKSTLMKKIAASFPNENIELYYCSSDANSLDAVILKDKKIIIIDGTAPHIFECKYPILAQEIINLGQFLDKYYLRENTEIIKKHCEENTKLHIRAKCFAGACSSLNNDIYSISSAALLTEKLNSFIRRISKKLFNNKPAEILGNTEFKQLSALTANSYATQVINKDLKIYVINDDFFAGGDIFLRKLAENAINSGFDIEISEFNIMPYSTYEHIIIPNLGVAFITQNFFNKLNLPAFSTINFNRFYDKEIILPKKQRLSFDKKASLEMLDEISYSIKSALTVHDDIEAYYINALNFVELNNITSSILEEISFK